MAKSSLRVILLSLVAVWYARRALKLGSTTGLRLATCSVLALLLLGATSPTTDPYQIYDRARDVWRKQTYPSDIQYRTTVHVTEGFKDEQEHYNGEASISGGIRVVGVSDEEAAKPHQATGMNFKIRIEIGWNTHAGGKTTSMNENAYRKESSPDFLGVPLISPEYSFGLDPSQQPQPAVQTFPDATLSTLPTIATVSVTEHAYDITLVATEPLGGLYAYHLRLQPRRDPAKFRLREMWIDAYSYDVLKLKTQGNFTGSPMNAVPWEITFQDIGGAMYIDTEKAEEPLAFRSDRTFTSASISFSDIKEADTKVPILPFMDSGQILREP
jgi:hypothetical protein